MRVLTVRQPWAFALVSLGKTVENRSTEWRYTGPLAIHAGAAFDTDALEDPALGDALRAHGWVSPPGVVFGSPAAWGATMHMGAVLGVVQMIGSHRAEPGCCPGNPWAQRDVKAHVVVRNPHPFQAPIGDVKGRLGLWKPGPDLLHAIGVRLADRPDELIEQLRRERVAREGANRGA